MSTTKRLVYLSQAAVLALAAALVVVAALALHGCATPPKVPQTPQQVINEGKETVLAVKRTINQNLTDGFYSADQAEKLLNQVEGLERNVRDAETLLRLGKGLEAQNSAAAARTALRALRTQVEKK